MKGTYQGEEKTEAGKGQVVSKDCKSGNVLGQLQQS